MKKQRTKQVLAIASAIMACNIIVLTACTAMDDKRNAPPVEDAIETTVAPETMQDEITETVPETETDIEAIKESIMETSEATEITAKDYKDAKEIEDIMKQIISKTN